MSGRGIAVLVAGAWVAASLAWAFLYVAAAEFFGRRSEGAE